MSNKDDLSILDEEFDDLFGDAIVEEKPVVEEPTTVANPGGYVKTSDPVVEPAKPVVVKGPAPAPKPKEEAPATEEDDRSNIKFGTKVSYNAIPRFKATATTKSRISILTDDMKAIKFHYVDGIGSFICMDSKCCEFEGPAKIRYVIPVVVYSNTGSKGEIIGQDIELKALAIGGETYDALVDIVEASGRSVKDVDIIVACSDEKYQKLAFAVDMKVTGASWKKLPKARELVEYYKKYRNKLSDCVARKIDIQTYLVKKGFLKSAEAPSVNNPEDLLDD